MLPREATNNYPCTSERPSNLLPHLPVPFRAGLLHTAHGIVETPVFMPVGTQATIKGVLPRDIESELDAKIILSNTYHLFLRPGHPTIRALGGTPQVHGMAAGDPDRLWRIPGVQS